MVNNNKNKLQANSLLSQFRTGEDQISDRTIVRTKILIRFKKKCDFFNKSSSTSKGKISNICL